MKKLGIIVMALVLALGYYAAPTKAFAAEVTAKDDSKVVISGEIRFRGEYSHNLFDQSTDSNKESAAQAAVIDNHYAYYDTRVRLGVEAKVAEGVTGKIQLESGTGNTTDTVQWGNNGTGSTGWFQSGNAKSGSMYLREAYINYKKDMFDLTVGHQEFVQLNKIFFDHSKFGDDGIKLVISPNRNVKVILETIKLNEGVAHVISPARSTVAVSNPAVSSADDTDAYVALVQYKGDTFSLATGADFVNQQTGGASYNAAHLWNFPFAGDVTFGPVTLRGDVEIQTGQITDAGWNRDPDMQQNGSNVELQGYAVLVGADYKIGDTKITLEYGYGSGDDGKNAKRNDTYITSLGADQNNTLIYDYKATPSQAVYSNTSSAGAFTRNYGLSNLEYIKFGAKTMFARDFEAEAYLFWLHAASPVSIHGASLSANLGYEADAKVTYHVAKNLKYYVEGGYMGTGDAYNWADGSGSANIYMVRHGLQLNF